MTAPVDIAAADVPSPAAEAAGAETVAPAPLSGFGRFARRFRRERVAIGALAVIVVLALVASFAGLVAPHDPLDQDLSNTFAGPNATHWLGTDELGRDTLSRIIMASRVALLAALQGVVIALAIGVPIGLFVGYRGGRSDRWVMRLVDAVIALPNLIVSIAILAALGPGLTNAMFALGLMLSTAFIRLTRGLVLSAREELYVDAARVVGAPTWRILARHVLPNVLPAIIVQTTLACSVVLLAEAGLSFLGLGVQPPDASWGAMLSSAVKVINRDAFLVVPPGVMIMITVLAFNLLGDGLRDAMGRARRGERMGAAATVAGGHRAPTIMAPAPATSESGRAPLLEVTDLSVTFPSPGGRSLSVLDGVSFSIAAGETVGLVGESGCGKTMSAFGVMGLIPAPGVITGGSIRLDGHELLGASDAALSRVRGKELAMIFQEPMTALNPAFTVANQIGEVLRRHLGLRGRAVRDRVVELLDTVGIPDARRRMRDYPHQFSGGMAQRVMIAMALAGQPRLLIADEPTTALDVTIQDQVLELLRSLQRDTGMAILFVTHDLGVVADVCDRAVVMYGGQVAEEAPIERLFAAPSHPYTAALLASMPQNQPRQGRLSQILGSVPPAWAWPAGCRFHPRCAFAIDACRTGHVPVTVDGPHSVRCLRAGELTLLEPV